MSCGDARGRPRWLCDAAVAVQVGEDGNCLRVEVIRGEQMPRTDITGKTDAYVVLTAQSEAGLQMFRGKTCWATLVRPPAVTPHPHPQQSAPAFHPNRSGCCGWVAAPRCPPACAACRCASLHKHAPKGGGVRPGAA